jgi:hypothetical protein
MNMRKDSSPQVTRKCSTDAQRKLSMFLDAVAQVLTSCRVGAELPRSSFDEASDLLPARPQLCIRARVQMFVNNVVSQNVCPHKHECQQASIMRTFKQT